MENMLTDWKFWGMIIQASITIGGFCLIKLNDFKHLTEDVKILDDKVTKIKDKLDNHSTQITKLEERTKKL